jgi:hypothetical protein
MEGGGRLRRRWFDRSTTARGASRIAAHSSPDLEKESKARSNFRAEARSEPAAALRLARHRGSVVPRDNARSDESSPEDIPRCPASRVAAALCWPGVPLSGDPLLPR